MSSVAKDQIRKSWNERRQTLTSDVKFLLTNEINKNLRFFWTEAKALSSVKEKLLWCGFKALIVEPTLDEAVQETSSFFRWAFPRILSEGTMEFREPSGPEPRWVKSTLGTWEPDPLTSEPVLLNDCFGVLVPGVAFDRQGGRIGMGKGYYDRALGGYTGLKVGICFSTQVSEASLPHEKDDVAMDALITDKEILFFRREKWKSR